MCSNWTRAAGVILLVGSSFPAIAQQQPTTRTDDFRESFHGKELIDPYHWLEDSTSPATRQWIDEQNAYAHALLDPLPIRAEINQRLTEMMRHDRVDAPAQRNGYYYFYKRGAGKTCGRSIAAK